MEEAKEEEARVSIHVKRGDGTLGPVLSGDGAGTGTEGGQDAPGEDGF